MSAVVDLQLNKKMFLLQVIKISMKLVIFSRAVLIYNISDLHLRSYFEMIAWKLIGLTGYRLQFKLNCRRSKECLFIYFFESFFKNVKYVKSPCFI